MAVNETLKYFVVGTDGNEYGPADVNTLQKWASEGRLNGLSVLKDPKGVKVCAAHVTGVLPLSSRNEKRAEEEASLAASMLRQSSEPPTVVSREGNLRVAYNWNDPPNAPQRNRIAPLFEIHTSPLEDQLVVHSILRSAVALVLFYLLNVVGVVGITYAVLMGYRAMLKDRRNGSWAFAISLFAFVIFVCMWAFHWAT